MVDLMTEEEQIIVLKTWWKRYGMLIVGGVIAGLVIYFSWSVWQSHNLQLRGEASLKYQNIVENLLAGDIETADKEIVQEENVVLPMPYALLEQWLVAEVEVKQQNWDQAIAHLNESLANETDPFLHELSSVRLARLYLLQEKPQEALDVLALINDKQAKKNPEVLLARGDAYAALGDNANARTAYTAAWDIYPTFSPQRQLIARLLAELPE